MARGQTHFISEMFARAWALPLSWWLPTIAITGGTNLLDAFTATGSGGKRNAAFAIAALIRVLLAFWITYALLRRLAGEKAPMRIGLPFLKSVLFLLASALVLGMGAAAARAAVGDIRSVRGLAVNWAVVTAIGVAVIRLSAWQTALAVGDRKLGPMGAWRHLAGCHLGLALAFLVASPIMAAHIALTVGGIAVGLSSLSRACLGIVDGIVSAAQLVLGCALAVAAWRAATEQTGPLREAPALA